MWPKHQKGEPWPSLDDSCDMGRDFKAMFPIKPEHARHNPGVASYPDDPTGLPKHVYDHAYGNEAPITRVILELVAIREHRVRVRSAPGSDHRQAGAAPDPRQASNIPRHHRQLLDLPSAPTDA
eukprot:1352933-Pyramimonas_sp.AAC.1